MRRSTRTFCAVLLLSAATLLGDASFARAQDAPPPGSTPQNPLPASGVQVGSSFTYYNNDFIGIWAYGWCDGLPYVEIWDSDDNTFWTVSFGGETVSRYFTTRDMPQILHHGWSVTWDAATDTICISVWSSPLLASRSTTYYGPIPVWEIP